MYKYMVLSSKLNIKDYPHGIIRMNLDSDEEFYLGHINDYDFAKLCVSAPAMLNILSDVKDIFDGIHSDEVKNSRICIAINEVLADNKNFLEQKNIQEQ